MPNKRNKALPRRIALIAHDNLKEPMVDWARKHRRTLSRFQLCATHTTGTRVRKALGLRVQCLKSGPLGGDQQIGAQIAEGRVGLLIFLWDPLSPHSHDVDIKALLRIAVVYDVPIACNAATADLLLKAWA